MHVPSDWQALFDVVTGERPDLDTRFRFWLGTRSLHLEIEATCEILWSPHTRRNAPLYEADALEVFLDPLGGGRIYRELEVSPTGAVFDAWILNRSDLGHPDARRDLRAVFPRQAPDSPRVEVHIDGREPDEDVRSALSTGLRARTWAAHWTIPYLVNTSIAESANGSLTSAMPRGSSLQDWRFNVFRIQHRGPGTRPRLHASRPTGRPDFHRPEAFALLAREFQRGLLG